MTQLYFRNMALLAKIETTEQTDAVPTGAANAILAIDATIDPLQARTIERNTTRPFMGAQQRILVGQHASVAFKVEMASHGKAPPTAPAAPGYGVLHRGCGLAQAVLTGAAGTIAASPPKSVGAPTGSFTYTQTAKYAGNRRRTVTLVCTTGGGSGVAAFTVSAPAAGDQGAYNQTGVVMTNAAAFAIGGSATITPTVGVNFAVNDTFTINVYPERVRYTPVSEAFESLTLYHYIDEVLHKLVGARGELGWMIESGIPYWTYRFNGIYVDPSDAATPAIDTSGFQVPLAVRKANTPVVKLHGYSAILQKLEAQLNNAIEPRILANAENVPISDRQARGSITIEMDKLVNKNWFTAANQSVLDALEFQHGDAFGKICRIDADRVEIGAPKYSNDRGVVMVTMDLGFIPSDAGNDEFELSCV